MKPMNELQLALTILGRAIQRLPIDPDGDDARVVNHALHEMNVAVYKASQ